MVITLNYGIYLVGRSISLDFGNQPFLCTFSY